MTHAELLALLLPPESYDPRGPQIVADLAVSGATLDRAQKRVADFLSELDPRAAGETLTDWERVYGLPDPCVPLGQSFAQRRAALVAKVLEVGGMTRDYYIAQAAALGYPGAVLQEFAPTTCVDHCDDALFDEAWQFVWQLKVPQAVAITVATCVDPCSEPLRSWGSAALECVMARIKPAHTQLSVAYGAILPTLTGVNNILETFNLRAAGWPGLITGGAVDGAAHIVATDTSAAYWMADGDPAWTADSDPAWPGPDAWAALSYTATIVLSQAGAGATLNISSAMAGPDLTVGYRRSDPTPPWTSDSAPAWTLDSDPAWGFNLEAYSNWPGPIPLDNIPYDFRVSALAGASQAFINDLNFTVEIPDVIEPLGNVLIAPGGTRLPVAYRYRHIKQVLATLQADANGGVRYQFIDYAASGPLVQIFNPAAVPVTGLINATVQGY